MGSVPGGEWLSVGLSLDGPADLHDAFRITADGGTTHARVTRSFGSLREHGVFCNVLCVLHARNTPSPTGCTISFAASG